MLKACTEHWNEQLSAWLDGETTPAETAAVAAHLETCADCRTLAELYRCDAQDTAATLAHPAPAGFADRVMAQVAVTPQEGPAPEAPTAKPGIPFWRRVSEWAVVCCVMAIVAAIIFPTFAKSREKARQSSCMNNVRQITLATQVWQQDHNQQFPEASTFWSDLAFPPISALCPTYGLNKGNGYGYNTALSQRTLEELEPKQPQEVLVIADSKTPDHLLHSNEDLDYRHYGAATVGYADGHVARLKPAVQPKGKHISQHDQQVMERLRSLGYVGSEATGRPAAATTPAPTQPMPVDAPPMPPSAERKPKPPTIAPPERNYGLADKLQIAYRASMTLHSPDVSAALEQTELAFRKYDGFVLTSDFGKDEKGKARATVSGRVPAEQLGDFLVAVDRLGTLVSRTVNGEDLTTSHLEHLEQLDDLAVEQRELGQIGDGARQTNPRLTVEDRRADAARAASGVRVDEYKLKTRVTLAEVSVTIATPPKPVVKKKVDPVKTSAQRHTRGLRAFAVWCLTAVLIPLAIWLPIWGPAAVVIIILWRRYLRPKMKTPTKVPTDSLQ